MPEEYADIIGLPRHVSRKHPQMSLEARAAQFASFAALVGYDEMIDDATEKHTPKGDNTVVVEPGEMPLREEQYPYEGGSLHRGATS